MFVGSYTQRRGLWQHPQLSSTFPANSPIPAANTSFLLYAETSLPLPIVSTLLTSKKHPFPGKGTRATQAASSTPLACLGYGCRQKDLFCRWCWAPLLGLGTKVLRQVCIAVAMQVGPSYLTGICVKRCRKVDGTGHPLVGTNYYILLFSWSLMDI